MKVPITALQAQVPGRFPDKTSPFTIRPHKHDNISRLLNPWTKSKVLALKIMKPWQIVAEHYLFLKLLPRKF